MTVAELIEKLRQMPQDAAVVATPSDCCGCGRSKHVEAELTEDGEVYIDASKYS